MSDFECLDQVTAAPMMDISRQTYGRILAEARGIVAQALVTGKALRIGGAVTRSEVNTGVDAAAAAEETTESVC